MENKAYLALAPESLVTLDPNTSYARIRDVVGTGKRVLDVGCGPGNLATVLRHAGNTVVGIDINDDALTSAKRVCERVFKADLDRIKLDELVGDDRFDVVAFADVLEHLRNPAGLLASSRRILRAGGFIVISIPNVAHGAVRLALLRGRFDYQQLGILDDSHLRFYTRESVLKLLSESGFEAIRIDRTTASVFESSDLVPFVRSEDYDPALVTEILLDRDAATLQFVVSATPLPDVQAFGGLRAEIGNLQQTLRTSRAQLAQSRESALQPDGNAMHGSAPNGSHAAVDRLAEVEQHYAHALAAVEEVRGERDAALAATDEGLVTTGEARAEVTALRERLAEREQTVVKRDQALAAAQGALAELQRGAAEREALQEAARDELRAARDTALASIEQLRAELWRVQQLADGLRAERDAAVTRSEAATTELERVAVALAETEARLRETQAMVGQAEMARDEALGRAAELERQHQQLAAQADAFRAQRDAAASRAEATEARLADAIGEADEATADARSAVALLEAALDAAESRDAARAELESRVHVVETELQQARDAIAHLEEELDVAEIRCTAAAADGADERQALRRRAGDLQSLLAVERTSRMDVEDACGRLADLARNRDADARQSELRRLQSRSAVVELELRLGIDAVGRAAVVSAPAPVARALSPNVVRRAMIGRRTVTLLAAAELAGRRPTWQRLKRLIARLAR